MKNKFHKIESIIGTIKNSKFTRAIAQLCYCTEMGYMPVSEFISCVKEAQEMEPNNKWKDILSLLEGEK